MSSNYSNQNPSYDEEEVVGEFGDDPISPQSNNGKEIMYNEEEYLAEVGEMNCYCVPTRVYGFKDFMFRTLGWTLLNKEQILGAFTVALTQIPEAITGALIAGVNPALALQSTWLMNILTAIIGGRPGMISGTTPFIGIALAGLVEESGVEYVYYAVMFAGFLQLVFGIMGLGALMRFVPFPVVQGFSNAMALYIVAAQFRFGKVAPDKSFNAEYSTRHLVEPGHSWAHITDNGTDWKLGSSMVILGIHAGVAFLICMALPKLTRVVPSAFVAIVVCTFAEHMFIRQPSDFRSALIEDFGLVKTSLMEPIWSDNDITLPGFNLDTFEKVYLYGLAVFGTGLCESLLATHIVDELTEMKGGKNRVAIGQGVANIVSSMFGGMGGIGSIAQSIVANHSD